MENNPQLKTQIETRRSFISYINPKENSKGFLASLAIFLAILGLGAYTSSVNKNPQNSGSGQNSAFTPIANNTVVYGYWTDKNSKIGAVDLSSGKIYGLATLDLKIKKATVISSQSLLFINKTDDKDHGREVALYNFVTKATTPLFQADQDFGIDDYAISPSRRYVADWEVQTPSGVQGLIGGRSRVYTINLQSPSQKNLIYDEAIQDGVPMHYPISITDAGEVFLDGFIANSQAGWANGMSFSNVAGTQKQDISAMTAGTYSSQPISSSDGKYLTFAGYDGAQGSGVSAEGFKQANLNPDTVEIFDTSSKQRKKLSGLSNSNRYPSVFSDKISGNIIFSIISKDTSRNGSYIYDIGNSSYKKLDVGQGDTVLSSLTDSKFLTGKQDTSGSAIGNLGEKYSSVLGSISVYDSSQNKTIPLNIGAPLIQYVGLLPSNYFNSSLSVGDLSSNTNKIENNQLQLETFVLKPTLAPQRTEQQSKPKKECIAAPPKKGGGYYNGTSRTYCTCGQLAARQCDALVGDHTKINKDNRLTLGAAWDACAVVTLDALMKSGTCYDSPLYLYGKEGAKVNIKVNTRISGSVPYSEGEYNVTLVPNGKIIANGKTYSSINFNYAPAIETKNLDNGELVIPAKVGDAIQSLGIKLGLNQAEINDLKASVDGKFESSYVLVSFYDEEMSKKILPISFDPTPNVYRNIVFYFKQLEYPINARKPKFDKIPQRKGFTAVEISHIIY